MFNKDRKPRKLVTMEQAEKKRLGANSKVKVDGTTKDVDVIRAQPTAARAA